MWKMNSGNVTEVREKRMAGISGLTATVDAIQTGKKTLLLGLWDFDNISPSPSEVYIGLLELVCCVGSGEKSGDVTEEGEKRTAGISGLNATVLAIQTGKKTLLLGLWDFDNISPSVSEGLSWLILLSF
nr:hypothetical protein [Tanacetum cinerariifolium]